MKTVLTIIVFFSFTDCFSQQFSCHKTSDTLLIFYVEIFKPKTPTQQFWSTAKEFNAASIDTKSIGSFVTTFLNDKNYCPDLPGGYREELFKCFKDSAISYIERLEKDNGNIYELFDAIKKQSFKRNFNLEDGYKVQLSIIKRHGTFILRDIETDKLGSSSDEYYINKKLLPNKVVFIPLKTFSSDLTIW
jgi:hypothetical protein